MFSCQVLCYISSLNFYGGCVEMYRLVVCVGAVQDSLASSGGPSLPANKDVRLLRHSWKWNFFWTTSLQASVKPGAHVHLMWCFPFFLWPHRRCKGFRNVQWHCNCVHVFSSWCLTNTAASDGSINVIYLLLRFEQKGPEQWFLP